MDKVERKEFLDILKMGYILVYKSTGSLFHKMIVKKQLKSGFKPEEAQYVHVEISGGEKHAIDISPPISKLIDITQSHKGRYLKIVKLRIDNFASKRYKVAYFSAALCNMGYDFRGILSFLFKWIKQDNRLYFCSEGAAWALNMVYPDMFGPYKLNEIMPAHFTALKQFETVWEGIIEESEEAKEA